MNRKQRRQRLVLLREAQRKRRAARWSRVTLVMLDGTERHIGRASRLATSS